MQSAAFIEPDFRLAFVQFDFSCRPPCGLGRTVEQVEVGTDGKLRLLQAAVAIAFDLDLEMTANPNFAERITEQLHGSVGVERSGLAKILVVFDLSGRNGNFEADFPLF